MKDQQVSDQCPIVSRDQRHQRLLDLHGISFIREAKPHGKTAHVSVNDDSFVDVERVQGQSRLTRESSKVVGLPSASSYRLNACNL